MVKSGNNYTKNNYYSYTGTNPTVNTKNVYLNSSNILPNQNNYQAQSLFRTLLTGPDQAGNVYVNNGYNISKLSPGISWTL